MLRPSLLLFLCAAALAIALTACAHVARRPAPREAHPPEAKARRRPTTQTSWYWEPVEIEAPPARKPLELPLAAGVEIERRGGAARLWDDLAPEARERVRRDGLVVVATDTPARSLGVFYNQLREARVPHLVTLDALFAVVGLGVERTLAELEESDLAPTLAVFLQRVESQLAREEAKPDVAPGLRRARGIVAVARALGDGGYAPPPDLEAVVAAERGLIEGHAGLSPSPLLGVVIDYTPFAPPSSAADPAAFRALAWLATAPLVLVGRGEAPRALVDIDAARANARAAMLLARVCDRDVDAETSAAYTRVSRLVSFLWGPPDDLSLGDVEELATAAGIDPARPMDIANVVRVDALRARARASRLPTTYDGAGGVGRNAVSVRLFGGAALPDAIALQGLAVARSGTALPSALDVAVWLGAPEARAAVHAMGGDSFPGYDAAATAIERALPVDGGTLHASVHGSLLDALAGWATTSGDGAFVQTTPPAARARLESILAAWTRLRSTGQPFTRPRATRQLAAAAELRIAGAPLPVFVEPEPEVTARLLGAVRQLRRGLEALAPSPSGRPMLAEIEDMLTIALAAATRTVIDEPATPEQAAAVASLPARIGRVEDAFAEPTKASAVVYSDPPSRRVLVNRTGPIEPQVTLARETGSDEALLVVGAHVGHFELASPGPRAEPERAVWVASFRWSKPASSPGN